MVLLGTISLIEVKQGYFRYDRRPKWRCGMSKRKKTIMVVSIVVIVVAVVAVVAGWSWAAGAAATAAATGAAVAAEMKKRQVTVVEVQEVQEDIEEATQALAAVSDEVSEGRRKIVEEISAMTPKEKLEMLRTNLVSPNLYLRKTII